MPKVSYHLVHPTARTTSVVFASPHSGRDYSWSFLRKTVLDAHTIRSSEDAYVDRLFEYAPEVGAVFLKAGAPRAFIDLNRGSDELDPALIEGVARKVLSPRIATGLGVIPRVVANGRSIYHGKMPLEEAQARIDTYWRPYHSTLLRLLKENHARFGQAILVDCHSMPREAVAQLTNRRKGRPEVVIGDRFGAAAAPEIVDQVDEIFSTAGFRVERNTPFAGAYMVQTYGRPSRNQHAIQIEIDRSLYMDEEKIEPNEDFNRVRSTLRKVIAQIAEIGMPKQTSMAAE